tara:strand:- start:1428 stop:2603 length:1176 start_codon:yes stop_codon:yes gene_type:complete
MPSHIPQYGNFFEFKKDEVFRNRIKVYPEVNLTIYSGSIYLNNENQKLTNFHTPNGHVNLYELNVNRNLVSSSTDNQMIYPFITKGGSFSSFKTITTDSHNLDFAFGDELAGSYPLTASISVDRYDTTHVGAKQDFLSALRTTLDFYTTLSPHYAYSSSFGDKTTQKLNVISIPSIYYGSSIKKGSVFLKYYVSGTLVAEASDTLKNGVLTQTSGSTTGENVGVILYNEGFIILTSSTDLGSPVHTEQYAPGSSAQHSASWHYFATTSSYSNVPSSSFSVNFKGTSYVETLTMFATAEENQINFSNNPTFLKDKIIATSGSNIYHEDAETSIKNIVTSSYKNHSASFKPVTYISKVGIYDKDLNLIAIAGIASPVRKLEERAYTFKLKLDI